MRHHHYWTEAGELGPQPLAVALMGLRREDGDNDLLMDSVALWELTEEADQLLALDGVVAQYQKLERIAGQMEAVMKRAAGSVKPVSRQVTEPFTQFGVLQVVLLFELSDGQTISVYFHNPDITPKKIKTTDELVSWKWLLNKKDVTILVAPEQGSELPAREVARRIMKAAEKNSAAFQRNNKAKSERAKKIEGLKTEIVELETEVSGLEKQIEVARIEREDRDVAPEPTAEPEPGERNINTVSLLNPVINGDVVQMTDGRRFRVSQTSAGKWQAQEVGSDTVSEPLDGMAALIAWLVDKDGEVVEPDFPKPDGYHQWDYNDASGNPTFGYMRFAPGDKVQQAGELSWIGTVKSPFGKPDHDRVFQELLVQWDNGAEDVVFARDLIAAEPQAEPEQESEPEPEPDTNQYVTGAEAIKLPSGSIVDALSEDGTLYRRAKIVAPNEVYFNNKRTGGWQKNPIAPQHLRGFIAGNYGSGEFKGRYRVVTLGEPSVSEEDDQADAVAQVDAAYRFANATDEFKAWLAESLDEADYSPFATAKAMDEKAKANGAEIEWSFFDGASMDSVFIALDDAGADWALDSEHWKKQPREKRTGRWRRGRAKALKRAASKAGQSVAEGAKKAASGASKAGSYVAQALRNAGSKVLKGGKKAADGAAEAAAQVDPGAAAINELLGGVRKVAGAFDSATLDAARWGHVGKIHKDGEIVGRVDMGDDGKAMVFVGADGEQRVQTPSGHKAMYSNDDAPAMIDWLFEMPEEGGDADAAPEPEPGTLTPEGDENLVKTAKGRKVGTGFALVEAEDLIASHDEHGVPNPDYPAELQPRDRGRESSIAWVRKTANQLDPDSLGRTRRADTGAPIVGPDGVVESGNGRTMAIREAYRSGKAEEYREWLTEEAKNFGLSPSRVTSMKHPVLVRVRTTDLDRREFAVEANQDDKLAMTATEKARADADRLDSALLSRLGDDGNLLAASNREFVTGFLQSLGDTEAAQYLTTDGQPTASLIARIQAAVFAKAYADDRLLELTADASKPEIANIVSALNAAAPEFIRAQAANKAGTDALSGQLADAADLSLDRQAVQAIIEATNLVRKAKADGQAIEEVVAQGGLFESIDPVVAAMAVFIAANNRSGKRLATAFGAMARHIREEAERGHTVDMFGDNKRASMQDIIAAANRELDKIYGEGEFAIDTPDLFGGGFGQRGPEPEPDHQKNADYALAHSVIDGTVADILSPELADQLMELYERHGGEDAKWADPELKRLAEAAMDAYEKAMMDAPIPEL